MKKICIVTATRAEYGLLKPIIKEFNVDNSVELKLVVTGMHLAPEFGSTYEEIIKDGLNIDKKIEILVSGDSPVSISKSMGLAIIGFSDYFSEEKPDLIVVLGDRYETLAVSIAAMNQRIPICHLYGGEATEGLIDEAIRHSITKMSYLHMTSTEVYRKRVIQLGEHPSRVFNVGAIGIENIKNIDFLSKNELSRSIGFNISRPFAVVTYHPVTLENENATKQLSELLRVISEYDHLDYIFTLANSDVEGRTINAMIKEFSSTRENCIVVPSLGMQRYLSSLKYCSMVIGNSSSGIIEAPSFNIPTINIGDRQKGRIQAKSIINCKPIYESIKLAFDKSQERNFIEEIKECSNPYEKSKTTENIVRIIKKYLFQEGFDIKKAFYDLPSIGDSK